ncbi:MAG: metallophosphoesterase [Chitinophagales bacterium]|nr:metallophosphoesterase [Chitinophagales bacterium]
MKQAISRKKFLKSILYIVPAIVLSDALLVERFFFETNEYYLKNSSKEKCAIKIVQISDLHIHQLNLGLKRVIKKIHELKPDLILFTGDAVDNKDNIHALKEFLQRLPKDVAKFSILGNWEYWGNIDLEELKQIYQSNNCTLLINESIVTIINKVKVRLTGIDDFVGGNANFSDAIKDDAIGNIHIVMNHCPQYNDTITQNKHRNIDLILSGHTHGGQVSLLGYVPFLPQGSGKYLKGWYEQNGVKMYISKGLGTSILPIRFGSRAEMAVFYF